MKLLGELFSLIVGIIVFAVVGSVVFFGGRYVIEQFASGNNNDRQVTQNSETIENAENSAEVSVLELYAQHVDGIDQLTGGKFPLLLKVRIKNMGSEIWHANVAGFTISNEDGKTFDFSGLTKVNDNFMVEDRLEMIDLLPNQSTEGWISFEPDWGTNFTLNYKHHDSYIQIPIEIPNTGEPEISAVYDTPFTAIISPEY